MVRNPHFKVWSKTAPPPPPPPPLSYSFGSRRGPDRRNSKNQADWTAADRLPELSTKYASQVHISPLTAFWYCP